MINKVKFQSFESVGARLTVYDQVPLTNFKLTRLFTVTASENVARGGHAHRECTQILHCISGKIEVLVDDGKKRVSIALVPGDDGLILSPLTWSEQAYQENSVLLVLCDKPYCEAEYVRDYGEFNQLVGGVSA